MTSYVIDKLYSTKMVLTIYKYTIENDLKAKPKGLFRVMVFLKRMLVDLNRRVSLHFYSSCLTVIMLI